MAKRMYAKIFEQIFDSSLADNYEARHVFIDLLILADSDGVVDMTPEAIARRTNAPLALIKRALHKLMEPDARSRTPDDDGRRLQLLDDHRDWGWQITNFAKFRTMQDKDQQRDYNTAYQRRRRARLAAEEAAEKARKADEEAQMGGQAAEAAPVNPVNDVKVSQGQSRQAEADVDVDKEKNPPTPRAAGAQGEGGSFVEKFPAKQNGRVWARQFLDDLAKQHGLEALRLFIKRQRGLTKETAARIGNLPAYYAKEVDAVVEAMNAKAVEREASAKAAKAEQRRREREQQAADKERQVAEAEDARLEDVWRTFSAEERTRQVEEALQRLSPPMRRMTANRAHPTGPLRDLPFFVGLNVRDALKAYLSVDREPVERLGPAFARPMDGGQTTEAEPVPTPPSVVAVSAPSRSSCPESADRGAEPLQ